jgi:NitT/TauT family transport system substrate-binding protein
MQEATFRMPWVLYPSTAPYFLALERGYYEQAGWDVEIGPGRGSQVTVQTVASGKDDFGVVTMDAALRAISEGADLKVVAVLQRSYPGALVYSDSVTIASPEDLAGPTIIAGIGDSYIQVLLAFLAQNGIPKDRINLKSVDFSAMAPLYRNTDGAVLIGAIDNEPIQFKQFDPNVQSTSFTDLGLVMYGNVIITSGEMIGSDPEGVRSFVAATLQGESESQASPQDAIDAFLKNNPDQASIPETALMGQLDAALGLSPTPLGPVDEEDLKAMLDFLSGYMDLSPVLPNDDYFTNEFLPASG